MHNLDNEGLRERVDAGVQRQKRLMQSIFFASSGILFVVFLVIAIGMLTSADLPPELVQGDNALVVGAFIMLAMGWLTSLIFQGISLLASFGVMDAAMRDRVIAREIGRQLYEQPATHDEKPKRHVEDEPAAYTVSDDGELVELDEESQRKRMQS